MKIVATFTKSEDAHLARMRLENEGITAFLRDENTVNTYALYSNAIGGVKLEVAEEDFARARAALKLPPQDEGVFLCPHCHSQNVRMRELSTITALSIALGILIPDKSRKLDCLDCHKNFLLADALRQAAGKRE